jgi:transcriptional regulator with XRE-family HTH domain
VAANVDRLRKEAGLTVGELISSAGLTKSYYQSRAGFQLPFNTNDIEALASALNVTPADLANPDPAPSSEIRVPVAIVASRVRRLIEAQAANEAALLEHLRDIDPGFAESARELLTSSGSTVVLPEGMLKAIAQWADVRPAYLGDPTDTGVADRTDAELELRGVMREVGASSIQFRALGEMSSDALRAIATSLRASAATHS